MTSFLGKTTSSQRWAAGAVALTLLFACSPQPTNEPAPPAPVQPQVAEPPAAPVVETPAASPAASDPPGYSGDWALADADCAQSAKTFTLSAKRIDMTPDKRFCTVTNIAEEHPTGRSMIYSVKADCVTGDQVSHDTFRLNFGASDTAMQLRLNDRDPIRLMRCGA